MKRVLTIALLMLTLTAAGQTAFNYDKDFKSILAKTKDKNSDLYYNSLLKRFTANDSTLSDFAVLALLIGFTDNSAYKPYADLDTEREVYGLNGNGKYSEALSTANTFLKKHPLSLSALFEKAYAFHKLNQPDSSQRYLWQGRRILKAMHSSGEGTSPENPIFALVPADGQDYIHKGVSADIGIMGSGRDKKGNFLDILEAKMSDGKSASFYFIIQHATSKMFTD